MLTILFWIACAAAAAWVYDQKGRSWKTGLLGGIVLGPLALLLAVLTPKEK